MTGKKRGLIVAITLLSMQLAACTWCKPAPAARQFSVETYFLERYFNMCYPRVSQLITVFPSMCVDALESMLHKTIMHLGQTPWEYFHVSRAQLTGRHLTLIVKEFKRLITFVRTHSVHTSTLQIAPNDTITHKRDWTSLFRYWQQWAAVDAHGCTVVDDLCAYYLSYLGTLFNSYALCPSLDYTFTTEQRKLRRCYRCMEALVNLLRSSPYKIYAETAWQHWERVYQLLERRFERPETDIKR